MKWSKMMIQTLRETPQDAEIDSHKLLVRAGLVKKLAGGLYTFLPLGMRTLRKVERIVREEMDRAGAQEILLPILQPAELWKTSGRWETMGPNMFKLQDRARHDVALSPTAEEAVTEVVGSVVSSYRQLPVTVYQIQTKFRDEIRPRFGLMRAKEFIMKDAYSFDVSSEAADASYTAMYEAYRRIFARCGLVAVPVEADTGDIGGKFSHEFHVLAEAGEDGIAACGCGYAANLEKAERRRVPREDAPCAAAEEVATPNARTIEEISAFLGEKPERFIKTLVYVVNAPDTAYSGLAELERGGGRAVMCCVAGDREVNEIKLRHLLDAKRVELAPAAIVTEVTGAEVGFAGPVGATVEVYADQDLEGARGMIVGANRTDAHIRNVDLARDAKVVRYADLAIAAAGDVCPRCGGRIEIKRGIEVGHVFKLGTKYTEAFHTVYKNDQLAEKPMVMGCYGIGVTRTVQAVIEQSHDANGIVWPAAVAPFTVVLELLDPDDAEVAKIAFDLETQFEAAGIDTLVDDRAERPGVKFKDADLIGFPIRVVVGAKGLANGGVEVKRRDQGKDQTKTVAPAEALALVRLLI